MKLAITADWLVTPGGAERVIAEMLRIWPEAPVFTTVYDERRMTDKRIRESAVFPVPALQRRYAVLGTHRPLIFSMPRAVESWDLRGFDVILSSSHAVAKGCIPAGNARHVCYCHTPMRYAWDMEERYLDDFGLRGFVRSFVKRKLRALREWDHSTAKRVDLFIANSRATRERIRRIYHRDSIVLHPPVDDRFFEVPLRSPHDMVRTTEGQYFFSVGRLVPYKRFDVLIEAANAARFPLKIAGEGTDGARLKRLADSTRSPSSAGPAVEFLGHVPEEELPALYRGAKATIFPVHEDAGIVPLESQACGTPVIALGKGGALDTVRGRGDEGRGRGQTGVFFEEQTVGSLTNALRAFETIRFDPDAIREHARQFSSRRFREDLRRIVCRVPGAAPR